MQATLKQALKTNQKAGNISLRKTIIMEGGENINSIYYTLFLKVLCFTNFQCEWNYANVCGLSKP